MRRPGRPILSARGSCPGTRSSWANGQRWLAPVAIAIQRSGGVPQPACALPWSSTWTPAGWQRTCQPRYRPLLELALRVMERAITPAAADVVVLATDGAEDEALAALQANYRLGRAEASALGLLTDDAIANVLLALIDGPSWGAEKKTARAGGSTSPGGAD